MGWNHGVCHGHKAVLGPAVKDKPGISKLKGFGESDSSRDKGVEGTGKSFS